MNILKGDPKPKLKEGVVYSGDNGRLFCFHCASQTAMFTKRDTYGARVIALDEEDNKEWISEFGKPLSCERGCTTFK